jgi:hypothetical protein
MPKAKKTKRRSFRVGDRVRIKNYRTMIAWGKRTPQPIAFITNINGAYILVRPRWQKHEIEFYQNEIEFAD